MDGREKISDIPDSFDIIAMVAIGKRGGKDMLPSKFQEMEKPSDRKPLEQMVMKGRFKEKTASEQGLTHHSQINKYIRT